MEKTLYMAEIDVVGSPDRLKTNLGSCIGIVLIDQASTNIGVAHIMLPKAPTGDKVNKAKYADTAIPALIQQMKLNRASSIDAKIIGGANMFADIVTTDAIQIGEMNIKSVKDVLSKLNIPIRSEDLGGTKGRQLFVDAESQKVYSRLIGEEMKEL